MVESEDGLCQPLVQGFQPPTCAADPSGKRGTRQIDAVPGEDLRLPVERGVVTIFGDQHCASSAGVASPPAIGRSGASC
jgi:hypothetical protein